MRRKPREGSETGRNIRVLHLFGSPVLSLCEFISIFNRISHYFIDCAFRFQESVYSGDVYTMDPSLMSQQNYDLRTKLFPDARSDAADSATETLVHSDAYKLAYADPEFLLRDELRAVRLQLEYFKPELIQDEHGIEATIVIFGSARFLDRDKALSRLEEAERALSEDPGNKILQTAVKRALSALENSAYYAEARDLGRIVTERHGEIGECPLTVVTGGGPGIMEAANRGAHDANGKSIGLNIVLPAEQRPNPYITPELCFQFHYFALRKMHFLMRARALVAFPGGFGTLDELFETLTLIQTGRSRPVPIVLVGQRFWKQLINFDMLVEIGTISEEDLSLFQFAETSEETWAIIADFYQQQPYREET